MKVSVYIATSLDGFIARKRGELDWLPGSDGEPVLDSEGDDFGYSEFMESVDALVMGRNTFETVLSFGAWPYEKRVIVLSRSLQQLPDNLPNTVELRCCDPQQITDELRESGVRGLYIDGGKTIQQFLNAGLIDELIISQVPVLIGSGIPLFGPLSMDVKLIHLQTTSFKNGFVQSTYQVIK